MSLIVVFKLTTAQMPRETYVHNKAIKLSLGCLHFRREVDMRISQQFPTVLGAEDISIIEVISKDFEVVSSRK